MKTQEIVIEYEPRSLFMPFHCRAHRWAVIVAHRRCGKTVACINDIIGRAMAEGKQDGKYAYIAPFLSQAKNIAWDYLQSFSKPVMADINRSDLDITLVNGARIRLYGADNMNALRGAYLDGVVLDEFGDMHPQAWTSVIRPMLSDRIGWATFIGTPKGKNKFYQIFNEALTDHEWFSLLLKASETGIIDDAELASSRKGMSPEEYDQEFECSFEAAIKGSFYGSDIAALEAGNRMVSSMPVERAAPVYTAWDIGIDDSTAIWFAQIVGRELHIIDYLENHSVGLDWYVKELQRLTYERGYIYAKHFAPHDAAAREWGSGKTREEMAKALGVNFSIVPLHSVMDGINAVRVTLPRMWFDKDRTGEAIELLRMYRADYDEKRGVLSQKPRHDFTSHCADAMRCLCMGMRDHMFAGEPIKQLPKMLGSASLNDLWNSQRGPSKENWI